MLQISQTENPICSATIDQMRLRRAMTLPLEFQNFSSSGFQSVIQVGSFWLIGDFLSGIEACSGEAPVRRCQNSDEWSRGTASMASAQAIQASCQLAAPQNNKFYKELWVKRAAPGIKAPLPKFAIRLFLVRRTINKQEFPRAFFRRPRS